MNNGSPIILDDGSPIIPESDGNDTMVWWVAIGVAITAIGIGLLALFKRKKKKSPEGNLAEEKIESERMCTVARR